MLKQCSILMLCSLYFLCFEVSFAQPVQLISQRDAAGNITPWYATYVDGNWYEIVPFKGTWQEAKMDAEKRIWQGRQGHLATLHTPEEIQFIAEQGFFSTCLSAFECRADYVNGLWLGGYQVPEATQAAEGWRWITNETWTLDAPFIGMDTYWHEGEPNDNDPNKTEAHREDRLTLTLFGTLNDISENEILSGYVIEYDLKGWVQWRAEIGGNDHWYGLVKKGSGYQEISFPQALLESSQLSWQGMQGHLATLTDLEEHVFVADNFIDGTKNPECAVGLASLQCGTTGRSYWIGGQYNAAQQVVWITGEQGEAIQDTTPVRHLFLNWKLPEYTWLAAPDAQLNAGYIVEFSPNQPATPNCYAAHTLALPHYDPVQEQLEMAHLWVRLYDATDSMYRDYYYKAVLKRAATPVFRLIVSHLEWLDVCQTPATQVSAFNPLTQQEPYFASNKIQIPYLQAGQDWYRVTLIADTLADEPPLAFVLESIDLLDNNTIPQAVLAAAR
jgi:hypothetical protein